jgi:hypothetical protein
VGSCHVKFQSHLKSCASRSSHRRNTPVALRIPRTCARVTEPAGEQQKLDALPCRTGRVIGHRNPITGEQGGTGRTERTGGCDRESCLHSGATVPCRTSLRRGVSVAEEWQLGQRQHATMEARSLHTSVIGKQTTDVPIRWGCCAIIVALTPSSKPKASYGRAHTLTQCLTSRGLRIELNPQPTTRPLPLFNCLSSQNRRRLQSSAAYPQLCLCIPPPAGDGLLR